MGTPLCFSSPAILRCESFTSLQSQLLIIPTALELIFSSTLIFTNWGTGRRHLLLTAEGWSYFALALLELLSHNIPAVRDNVTVFSIVDIVLGATSFIPIFLYTLFVYLFTRGELTDTLPKRFQRVATVLLVFFIPVIVGLNELSSFIGISRGTIPVDDDRRVVAIGFRNSNDQQLWTFLSSITLALLTAFQAINFCFAFYRLVRAFIDQRRIETTSSDQAHLIRGIGWISGGFKLGAIESVIGFAQGGFGGAFTRRIVRFLARAFLIIGIVKGVDHVDDFTNLTRELSSGRKQQSRRSRLGMLISNPRFSTFRQLSPTANEFYDAPRGNGAATEAKRPDMRQFSDLKRDVTLSRPTASPDNGLVRPRQRVTVAFDRGAPTLHMRFSGLEMPNAAVIAESVKSRPISTGWVNIARSSQYAPSAVGMSFRSDNAPPVPGQPQHRRGQSYSAFSTRSSGYPESSLSAVRELAEQFPVPVPAMTARRQQSAPGPSAGQSGWVDDDEDDGYNYNGTTYASPSTQTTATPRANPYATAYAAMQTQAFSSPEEAPPMRYVYGQGMEYPESPEPVYRYAYDGHASSPEQVMGLGGNNLHQVHYASSPPTDSPSPPGMPQAAGHRNMQSQSSLGITPMTILSRFTQSESTTSTPGTEENPFRYDEDPRGKGKGRAYSPQGVPEPVYMDDGPHGEGLERRAERSSAALLQMTQRDDAYWTPAELTSSMFVPAPVPAPAPVVSSNSRPTTPSSGRATLKKKRRPSAANKTNPPPLAPVPVPAPPPPMEPLASTWLQGDSDGEDAGYADDESRSQPPGRVKSVGRNRAPRKATPTPLHARTHGITRGSVHIQPITVPPMTFHSEVQIVQGGSSADSWNSEFADRP